MKQLGRAADKNSKKVLMSCMENALLLEFLTSVGSYKKGAHKMLKT